MTAQDRLLKNYKDAYEKLLKKIAAAPGADWNRYYKRLLKEIEKAVAELDKSAARDLAEITSKAYSAAEANALKTIEAATGPFGGKLNRSLMQIIAENAVDQLVEANHYFGRHLSDSIRQIGLDAIAEKVATGQTVREAQRQIIDRLKAEGLTTVTGGSGKNFRLDSYAQLVARTTTREATNTGTTNTATQLGYDLVKFSSHYPTCEVCAPVQGRVFSISGKDERFPALSSVPGFSDGFKTIHPNCRHVLVVTVEALWTDEERERYLADAGKPVTGDTRGAEEVNRYNAMQAEKRERWQDRRQYEKYKAALGDDAPKTFSGFRAMKRADSNNWGVMQAQFKGMQYYNKAVKNEPGITSTVIGVADKLGVDTAGLGYRIKGKESYLRKIKSNYSPDGNSYEVKDILRYTLTADPDKLAEKTNRSIEEFEKLGYTTVEVKNSWLDKNNPYKGINTIVRSPDGQKFEVQYHTAESFDLKNGKLHELYEKQRVIDDATSPEYIRLRDKMFDLSDSLTVPDRVKEVRNK